MSLRIVVTAKQVIDPETPASAFRIDPQALQVLPPASVPPVVNGFDEQAVEAALQIKDADPDTHVTVLSMGTSFAMDVMKKPLAMGADELVLLQDDALANSPDPSVAVRVLAAAIRKLGEVDLVLCGRQASDWDNAQVPLGLAEELGLAVTTIAKGVAVENGLARVERVLPDGSETVEMALPALVTVSNELGQARYPTLRGIMAAGRKAPTIWSVADVGLDMSSLTPGLELVELALPESGAECEFIEGEDDADAGRKLALKLREAKLV